MKERPILFSAPMVRALLDGRKTQTRRIFAHKPLAQWPYEFTGELVSTLGYPKSEGFLWAGFRDSLKPDASSVFAKCPYGAVGDRLWVKEAWRTSRGLDHCKPTGLAEGAPLEYLADQWIAPHGMRDKGKVRTPLFMRRWMSRIVLEITAVRVERVQSISKADAVAEGIAPVCHASEQFWENYQFTTKPPNAGEAIAGPNRIVKAFGDPVESYRSLWDSINGKGLAKARTGEKKREAEAARWASNPWVWGIEFRRVAE